MRVYVDMDGTIADLYDVPGWLGRILAEDDLPYRVARPCGDLEGLKRLSKRASVTFLSWGPGGANDAFLERVRAAKRAWLDAHGLESVPLLCIPYGTPKSRAARAAGAYLLDDERRNIEDWERAGGFGVLVRDFADVETFLESTLAALAA